MSHPVPALPVSFPSTGDTDKVLPQFEADPRAAADATAQPLEPQFALLTRNRWPAGKDLRYPQTVALLRDGIDVEVWCHEKVEAGDVRTPFGMGRRNGGTARVKHLLRMHPDGSVAMLDHHDYTHPTGGSSADLDVDAELFLKSLGTPLPACVQVVLWLLSEQRDPTAFARLRKTFGYVPSTSAHSPFRARALYAAVAWAQHDVWPVAAWDKFIDAGVTPRVLAYWVTHGWAVTDAVRFLNRYADFTVAEQWRLHGDTSNRAARFASIGDVPDDNHAWAEVGFEGTDADKWRFYNDARGPATFTPQTAWQWHCRGVLPNSVSDFKSLPVTDEQAANMLFGSAKRRNPNTVPHGRPTPDVALKWTAAGMPSDLVLAWHGRFGDNLPLALDWASKIPVAEYEHVAMWNEAHPESMLTPNQVYRLRRLGLPYRGDLMGRLVEAGYDTVAILRPLHMVPAGKRWLGIELRGVLERHIRSTRAGEVEAQRLAHAQRLEAIRVNDALIAEAEQAGTPLGKRPEPNSESAPLKPRRTAYEVLLEAVEAGDWDAVIRKLRDPWWSSLWAVYVDWLCTHPTPPSHPPKPVWTET